MNRNLYSNFNQFSVFIVPGVASGIVRVLATKTGVLVPSPVWELLFYAIHIEVSTGGDCDNNEDNSQNCQWVHLYTYHNIFLLAK